MVEKVSDLCRVIPPAYPVNTSYFPFIPHSRLYPVNTGYFSFIPNFPFLPLQYWLFTLELQWQSRGKWRILQGYNREMLGVGISYTVFSVLSDRMR